MLIFEEELSLKLFVLVKTKYPAKVPEFLSSVDLECTNAFVLDKHLYVFDNNLLLNLINHNY